MFNLIVRDLKNYREEFPIESQVVVIGRDENAHIQIPSNKISRKQFRIISKGMKLYIEDLNSSNGTFLNEEKVEKIVPITENDVIQFGNLYAQLNNTNKIKKNFKVDDIIDAILMEREKKSEKPFYRLVSKDKRYPGLIFELEEGFATLGRTSASNIVVPADTLSKKHLKFNRKGQKLFLEDLGSINGTMVNGRKLREIKQVYNGDKIEIGDVKFVIQSNIQLENNNKTGKKKLIIIASVVLVLILLALGLRSKKKTVVKKQAVITVDDKIENTEKEHNRYLAKAEKYAFKAEWDKSISYCQKVLDDDPANNRAREYKSRYLHEKDYKVIYNMGKESFELQSFEDAILHFKKIPKESFYKEKAKLHARESREKLKIKYFDSAKVYYKSRRLKDAYAELKKLFNVSAYHSKAIELKSKIEKAMRRHRIKFKKFDVKLNDEFSSKKNVGNIKENIKKVFKEKETATPIEYYVNGNIEYAIKYFNQISVTNKYYTKTRPLLKTILLIKNKYALGNTYIVKKDYGKARFEWEKVLKADKELLEGTGVKSKHSEMIRHHLSDGFYKRGKQALKAKKYKTAFLKLTESLKYNPNNTYTLSELSKIRKISNDFWNKSLQFEKSGDKVCFRYWGAIVDMTDKKSELHKKAMDKLNNAAQ